MREQAVPSDQGWFTSSESSESSSDQSTMNSPRRVHQQQSSVHANSMTSAILFANKTPAASQSVLALMQSKSGSRSPTGGLGSPGFIHVHRGQGYSRCYWSLSCGFAGYVSNVWTSSSTWDSCRCPLDQQSCSFGSNSTTFCNSLGQCSGTNHPTMSYGEESWEQAPQNKRWCLFTPFVSSSKAPPACFLFRESVNLSFTSQFTWTQGSRHGIIGFLYGSM